jgi:GAF domain-containing protein/anti-sigma regulatory factor (Ser/Thr protein kinase)
MEERAPLSERVVGALFVADRLGRAFTDEEMELAETFANHAAIALENARLHAEARRRLAETEALLAVAQVLGSTLESTEMLRRVARESARAFGADMAGAYVPDAAGGVLRAVAGYHVPEHLREPFQRHPIPLRGHPFLQEAWESRRPVWSSHVGAEAGVDRGAFERAPHRSALFVPMVAMDRAVAALHLVWWTAARDFSAEEIRLAEAIAPQVGLAFANAQLYQKSDERRREAEALAAVAGRVSASLDPAEVSAAIVDSVLSLFRVDSAILVVRESSGRSVVIAASGLARAHFPSGSVFAWENSVVRRVLVTGRPTWSPDVQREPEEWRSEELRDRNRRAGIHAVLGVPLAVKGRIIGALTIADQTIRDFSTEEIALLQAFGDQAAIALENARLYGETERARGEAEVLAEIASALNVSLDLDEILKIIVTAAKTLTGGERATIALWDSSMKTMTFRYEAGPTFAGWDSLRIESGKGAAGYVLETGRPFRTDDYAGDSRITKDFADAVAASETVAVVVVPIVSGGLVQGLVYVANRSADPFTDEDEAILVRLADHAAIAVTNARLFAREKAARAAAQATADVLEIRVAQHAAVAELGQRALSDEDLTTLIADAAALVARNLSAEYSEILEVGSDGADFLLRAGFGWSGDEIGRARRPGGSHTPGGACLQFGEAVIVEDVHTDARFPRSAWLDDYGIVSSAIVAIQGLIPPFGVLAIHTTRRRMFSPDDISVLRAVANVLGLAMLRRRTEDIFRQHADRLAILREVDEAILAAESPRAIANAALRHLLQLIPSWRASVTLLDLDHSIGTVFAAVGAGADVLPGGSRVPFEPADVAELRNDDALVVQDTSTDPRSTPFFRDLVARGIRGFVLMPLAVEGRLMGSLSLAADRPNFFTAEHVEIAREAAKPLALALHHARLRNEMREGRERLQALSRRLVNVQEEERRRLARDLHDEIGQILTGLKFTLASSDRCADAAIRTDLTRATDLVSDLIGRVRELSLDLRPSMLDDLGLVPALLFHVDRYTAQTKVRVRMEHSGIEGQGFPREIETAAYRIVQEALTNVARHAGVEAAIVRVWTSGATLGVQIVDEGCGCDPVAALQARDGGLAGMRERAALLGGQLDVESSPGAGVRITATLPLDEPVERRRALR